MSKTVGLGVLVEDTGETPRTLQHWSDLGILRPITETNKRGRGYYREFPAAAPFYGERTWALIASALNDLRIPLGDIKIFIDRFRKYAGKTAGRTLAQQERSMGTTPIGRAIQGSLEVIMVTVDDRRELCWAQVPQASPDAVEEAVTFEKGTLGNKEDWTLYPRLNMMMPGDFIAENSSAYVLNLTRILAPLRAAK